MSPSMGEYFFFRKNYRRLLDTKLIETAHSPTPLLTHAKLTLTPHLGQSASAGLGVG